LLPNWLDAEHIPIENGSGDDEIPKAGKNRRLSGKARINILARENTACLYYIEKSEKREASMKKHRFIPIIILLGLAPFFSCMSGPSSTVINANNKILVYGDEQCWNCQHFRKSLEAANIAYSFFDVDADSAKSQEMWNKINAIAPGTTKITFPIVDINGKVLLSHPITYNEIEDYLKY